MTYIEEHPYKYSKFFDTELSRFVFDELVYSVNHEEMPFSDITSNAFTERILLFLSSRLRLCRNDKESNAILEELFYSFYYSVENMLSTLDSQNAIPKDSWTFSRHYNFFGALVSLFNECITEVLRKLFNNPNAPDALDVDCVQQQLLHLVLWRNYGKSLIRVAPELEWRLENTKLKNYPADQLKLPNKSIFLSLPHKKFYLFVDKKKVYLSGCYIHEEEHGERSWKIMAIGDLVDFPNSETVSSYDFYFNDEETIETCLNLFIKENDNKKGDYLNSLHRLFPYIMNVVLYATMPDADTMIVPADPQVAKLRDQANKHPKGSKKRARALAQLSRRNSSKVLLLGGNIIVDKSKDRYIEDNEGATGTSRKQMVRSIVSGHWKDQPCGPKAEKRKRIWIEPYWRGPEYAPLTNKVHVLR